MPWGGGIGAVDGGIPVGVKAPGRDAEHYAAMLARFSSQEVSIGTSRTNPPKGSLGEWLKNTYKHDAVTSYVGPILLKEQYAERGSRSDRIRFKFRPAGETAIASPRTLVS